MAYPYTEKGGLLQAQRLNIAHNEIRLLKHDVEHATIYREYGKSSAGGILQTFSPKYQYSSPR